MRERAALLGGRLEAGVGDGAFRVRARLPVRRRQERRDRVRVLIVDDDDLMRAGLRAVLSSDDAIEVVGEAARRPRGDRARARAQPDVVLMDVRMPEPRRHRRDARAARGVARRRAS